MTDRKVELLVPAGSLEVLKVAVDYGADAVYIGGQAYGLRAKADNFSIDEMKEAAAYAHAKNAKVYVTANIFAHNYDIDGMKTYFEQLKDTGVDAVLVSDPGIFTLAKETMPDMELHISTQANNTNYLTYNFWYKLGAKRVVTARELSLAEIRQIRDHIPDDMEIESFMHGAMCISYSGRCLLSSYFTGRDANRGACTHPCRWKYHIVEETRPGEYMPVNEDDRGTYIFNSKDLCMVEHMEDILTSGIDSLKIEGRAKTFYYVASVTAAYRKALDQYLADPLNDDFALPEQVLEELTRTSHRHYSPGFYFGREQARQATDSATYIREWEFVGTVDGWENGIASCQQRGKWSLGDTLEALCPDGRSIPLTPEWIKNEAGEAMESTPHAMEKYTIPTPQLPPMSLLRRKV